MSNQGHGSFKPVTVMEMFEDAVKELDQEQALFVERKGKWISWTWHQYRKDAMNFAKALINIGVRAYECVNILSFNSPEWFITFIGGMYASVVPVGIYLTNNKETCMYIAKHSECGCLVIDSLEQFKKYDLAELKYLKAVVFTCEISKEEIDSLTNPYATIFTWDNFLEIGKNAKVAMEFKHRNENQRPGNCCDIVYTSGTTGTPKAVMLSHDNLTWTVKTLRETYTTQIENRQKMVSFLPLSHIAGQIVDIMRKIKFFNFSCYILKIPSILCETRCLTGYPSRHLIAS
jgi:long-chain-fatty-acid--CoA ligase ACSBG